jgi:hypothetical protein
LQDPLKNETRLLSHRLVKLRTPLLHAFLVIGESTSRQRQSTASGLELFAQRHYR